MTIQELLIAAAKKGSISFRVRSKVDVRHAKSDMGTIERIEPNAVGVKMDGMHYYSWFRYDIPNSDDRRSKYLRDLEFIEETETITYEELTYRILSAELIDRPEKLRNVSKMLSAIIEGIEHRATNK